MRWRLVIYAPRRLVISDFPARDETRARMKLAEWVRRGVRAELILA